MRHALLSAAVAALTLVACSRAPAPSAVAPTGPTAAAPTVASTPPAAAPAATLDLEVVRKALRTTSRSSVAAGAAAGGVDATVGAAAVGPVGATADGAGAREQATRVSAATAADRRACLIGQRYRVPRQAGSGSRAFSLGRACPEGSPLYGPCRHQNDGPLASATQGPRRRGRPRRSPWHQRCRPAHLRRPSSR